MIRAATLEDASRLAEIHIASWQAAYAGLLPADYLDGLSAELEARTEQWRDRLSTGRPPQTVLVAAEGARVLGFAHTGPAGDKDLESDRVGELYAMYLDPQHYRQGWGSLLMTAAADQLRRAGFTAACLWVMTANAGARAFYEQAGWHLDGAEADQCLGITVPAVRYRAEL